MHSGGVELTKLTYKYSGHEDNLPGHRAMKLIICCWWFLGFQLKEVPTHAKRFTAVDLSESVTLKMSSQTVAPTAVSSTHIPRWTRTCNLCTQTPHFFMKAAQLSAVDRYSSKTEGSFLGLILWWTLEQRQLWVQPFEWLKLNSAQESASCVVHQTRSCCMVFVN